MLKALFFLTWLVLYQITPLDIKKKAIVLFHTLSIYYHATANWSAIKYTYLIPGNICLQDESMVKPMYTLVMIHHHVERIV